MTKLYLHRNNSYITRFRVKMVYGFLLVRARVKANNLMIPLFMYLFQTTLRYARMSMLSEFVFNK